MDVRRNLITVIPGRAKREPVAMRTLRIFEFDDRCAVPRNDAMQS